MQYNREIVSLSFNLQKIPDMIVDMFGLFRIALSKRRGEKRRKRKKQIVDMLRNVVSFAKNRGWLV